MKKYTVNEIMNLTNQKRGTIEQFRSELITYGIITNNESIDDRSLEVFKKAIICKSEEDITWSQSMKKAIQNEYCEDMKLPFKWSSNIILNNLIWQIDTEKVLVQSINDLVENGDEIHIICNTIIANFKELGKIYDDYFDSFSTDCNSCTTYKCSGEDYIYYVIGKINHLTGNEDIHVFYNDGKNFNIMRCEHICGGNCEKGILKELWRVCSKKAYKSNS